MKILALMMAGIILFGAGCVSQANTETQTLQENNSNDAGNNGAGANSNIVEVNLKNFEFNPSTIVLSAGQTIRFVNQDGAAHDVHLIKDGIDFFPRTQINAGSTIDVEITEAGTYELICDRHAPGMSGMVEAN